MNVAGLAAQRSYYDARWAKETFANQLQLSRTLAILEGIRASDIRDPRILDLGCGTGWLSGILARFGPTTGIDLSPLAVEKARQTYPDVQFLASDFLDLPTADGEFDIVVSQEVIEHVTGQREYVDQAARCLRRGGYLILTTPNAWNFTHWDERTLSTQELQPIEQWLTTRQLRALLEPQFRIIQIRTIILGGATQGIFRIVNSVKLAAILTRFGLRPLYEKTAERLGFGMHITLLAERR
jgi:2-polyprenyl-3-methyl-5-hydroxy-6-metoxy-1,4-benzoquinol methylase